MIDEQAYYLMPLMTGVVPEAERPPMLEKLEQNILVKNKGHLDTGMLGTYFLMEHLREIGRNDLVFTMFNQTTHPGWGHMLAEGATTLLGAVERPLVAHPLVLHLARQLALPGPGRHPARSAAPGLQENHHPAGHRGRFDLGQVAP